MHGLEYSMMCFADTAPVAMISYFSGCLATFLGFVILPRILFGPRRISL